jgi:hypothetical protein
VGVRIIEDASGLGASNNKGTEAVRLNEDSPSVRFFKQSSSGVATAYFSSSVLISSCSSLQHQVFCRI